jgi:hypothetical protein
MLCLAFVLCLASAGSLSIACLVACVSTYRETRRFKAAESRFYATVKATNGRR